MNIKCWEVLAWFTIGGFSRRAQLRERVCEWVSEWVSDWRYIHEITNTFMCLTDVEVWKQKMRRELLKRKKYFKTSKGISQISYISGCFFCFVDCATDVKRTIHIYMNTRLVTSCFNRKIRTALYAFENKRNISVLWHVMLCLRGSHAKCFNYWKFHAMTRIHFPSSIQNIVFGIRNAWLNYKYRKIPHFLTSAYN
jgi:hypothetical protein